MLSPYPGDTLHIRLTIHLGPTNPTLSCLAATSNRSEHLSTLYRTLVIVICASGPPATLVLTIVTESSRSVFADQSGLQWQLEMKMKWSLNSVVPLFLVEMELIDQLIDTHKMKQLSYCQHNKYFHTMLAEIKKNQWYILDLRDFQCAPAKIL